MKRIVVSGGTGYVGRALVRHLLARGDSVTVLTRGASADGNPRRVNWDPYELGEWARALDGADAVVHLAGERALGVRYTELRRQLIRDSRVVATQNVASALEAASVKPRVLVSCSAVGYYGDHSAAEPVDESCGPGDDFLARLCVDWEAASERARDFGVRVVNPRMGVVLGPDGGALGTMALPFKLFVGGRIASGSQGVSWIQLEDAVAALTLCIDHEAIGPKVNLCSPNPASNAELSAVLARALGRPNWLPAPAFALKALFGEGAEPILTGQYVVPRALEEASFVFRSPNLQDAVSRSL